MTSKESDGVRAEFLRSPETTTLVTQNPDSTLGLVTITVRYTLDGMPVGKNTRVVLQDEGSQRLRFETYIGDDNGVAMFRIKLPPEYDVFTVTALTAAPNPPTVTYKVRTIPSNIYQDPRTGKTICWPPSDAILPRGKTLYASAYLSSYWGNNGGLGLGYWDSSEGIDIQALPGGWRFPDNSTYYMEGAQFLIPLGTNIDGNRLSITPTPFSSSNVGVIRPYWWRVESAKPARQIYITPVLESTIQRINCAIVVTATFVDEYGKPVRGQLIQWSWQRQLLNPPTPIGDGVTDVNGRAQATIHVPGDIALAGRTDTLVASSGPIQATCRITFAPSAGTPASPAEIMEPPPGAQLTIGQPNEVVGAFSYLDRTYTKLPNGLQKILVWTTDPFCPDISFQPKDGVELRSSGMPLVSATVTAKSGGTIPAKVALVGAVPNPAAPDGMDIIRVDGISFGVAGDASFIIEAPADGAQLPVGREVCATVRFTDRDGGPIFQAPVTFFYENPVPADGTLEYPKNRTMFTLEGGQAHGTYKASEDITADLHATAVHPETKQPYYASVKGVKFTAQLDGPGEMTLHSDSGTDLRTGVPYTFTLQYHLSDGSPADGEVVVWSAPAGISLSPTNNNNFADIIRNGVVYKTIERYTKWGDALNVEIAASSINPEGRNPRGFDSASVVVNFLTKGLLQGLAVDKTSAANPFDGQFHPEQPGTVIQAALELRPGAPTDEGEQVTLSLPGFGAPVRLYGSDGKELKKLADSPDGSPNYLATFDASSRCDFWIMSPVFSLFTLQAKYGDQPALSNQLLIADIDNAPPGDIDPPYIHGLQPDQPLVIDKSSYTFNVRMDMEDAAGYIDDRATIALWLNGRVVFAGTGRDIDMNSGGVHIGYAGLNPGEVNKLVLVFNDANVPYKRRTFTANPLLFEVEGSIPSEPVPGTLKALEGMPERITAWNAAQGIELTFTDPKAIAQARSVFCFFEDSDSHVRTPRNVVRFDVQAKETSVVIPQMYLAGYTMGSSLRVYYSIGSAPSQQWSQAASAMLDTDSTRSDGVAPEVMLGGARMVFSKEH